jgi:hypothetical protein
MVPIKKYFDEADRKALYALLSTKKQEGITLLDSLLIQKNKHTFRSDLYGNDGVKNKLLLFFHGKCAYCEDFMGNVRIIGKPYWDWQIEHYRPKAGVTEDSKHKGYYWLAYECTNFLIVCPVCNSLRYKGNRFPILSKKGAIRLKDTHFIKNKKLEIGICTIYNPIFDIEKPILLNPVIDSPKDFIQFLKDGTIEGKNERGEESIKIYGLNRQTLCLKRKEIIDSIRNNMALTLKTTYSIQGVEPNNQVFKNIINHHLKQLRDDIMTPESTFIAFRCAIFVNFDSFVITNDNGIGNAEKSFIMPFSKALLNAYLEIKNQ